MHPLGKSAMVLFETEIGLEKALRAHLSLVNFEDQEDDVDETNQEQENKVQEQKFGIRKIVEDLRLQSMSWKEAREVADNNFKKAQERIDILKQEEEGQQPPQDDGWTVVRRGRGRKRVGEGYETSGVSQKVAEKVAQHRAKKQKTFQLQDFYKFQKREERMSQQFKLIRKFEEDKKRIKQHRSERMFKPS
eukprot:TRINITY_DN3405_c0_g1_i1.p2 TRINITY_DN3405_c0_g1~~TRINITY_DN3405_c0_g1_i1.p2  ORF type:complete len:191 (-),score=39.19 TRINITY_DN3405_c0_g1_i1:422-994(-)